MKSKIKSILVTILLLILLLFTIWVIVGINIIGPSSRYDNSIIEVENSIKSEYKLNSCYRDLFKFELYIGFDNEKYYFFDSNKELLFTSEISSYNFDKAVNVFNNYLKDYEDEFKVYLTYGFDSVVYRVNIGDRIILVDALTYEVIYDKEI